MTRLICITIFTLIHGYCRTEFFCMQKIVWILAKFGRFTNRGIMDFNGKLLTRCGKTYLRSDIKKSKFTIFRRLKIEGGGEIGKLWKN